MSNIDWIVLGATLLFITLYGIWKSGKQENLDDYLLGKKENKWWMVGFAVMATQASAITFLSTTGQGFADGMQFVQFYFGLPLAMLVISYTFIPIFYKLKVFSAYEFLEQRFDIKTRTLTAGIFLIQRGLAAGITLYAPSIVLSYVLGWDLKTTHVITGILVILYTTLGGAKAVTVTQLQQMAVIFIGMVFIFCYILYKLPEGIGLSRALEVAGNLGKMEIISFDLDWNDRYNIWAGLAGGFFLALSYFGTDQSQVQRYLSGKNIKEARLGLIMNGILKIPMQFFILLTGVLVFVYFQYNFSPIHYNTKLVEKHKQEHIVEFSRWESEKDALNRKRITLLHQAEQYGGNERKAIMSNVNSITNNEQSLKQEVSAFIKKQDSAAETNDKDYVFLHFILNHLPQGLIGLLLAVIFCAAMSSISAELNALAGVSMVDFYKRFKRSALNANEDVKYSKLFTVFWGLIAIGFAWIGNLFENLIQYINIMGSLFYGTVLGIFLVAFYIKKVKGTPVFISALIALATIWYLYLSKSSLGFLWYNVIACGIVVVLSLILNVLIGKRS